MTQTTESALVSIVIPAYNAAWCVSRAIDSVLAQDIDQIELIVVDDGSTDDTATVLAGYGDRIRVVSQANGGMSHARNSGIRASTGRYLAFLDADDWWLPGKLRRQIELLESAPHLAFCSATARLEAPDGQHLGDWACSRDGDAGVSDIFANHAAVAGGASSVLARGSLVRALGGFDESLFGAEDTDLWVRLAAEGSFRCIMETCVVVLKRPDSVSRNRDRMRAGALAMSIKNRNLLPPALRGRFWRNIYAGILCDYAKWSNRDGLRGVALRDAMTAFAIAPRDRGRLSLSIAVAVLTGQPT